MKTFRLIRYLTLAGMALVAGLFLLNMQAKSSADSVSRAGSLLVPTWIVQADQASATDSSTNITLMVKGVLVLPKELQIFYVIQSTQAGTPQWSVRSCTVGSCVDLTVVSVQSLGSLGGKYNIGVVHISWTDEVNQTIQLHASTTDGKASWIVTPLRQQASVSDPKMISYLSFRDGPADLQFAPGIVGGATTSATLKIAVTSSAATSPSQLFVKVNKNGTLSPITEAEYQNLNTVPNQLPNSTDPKAPPASTVAPVKP